MNNLSVAVIGLGGAGSNHARTLASVAGVRLLMVVDKDEGLAKSLAAELGVERFSTDYRDALGAGIDAVTVATPPFLREEIVVAAAKAGKHILCEKPFAITLESALRMESACSAAGVKVMVNFGARNLPVFQKVRELVMDGKHGRPKWIWLKYMLPARVGVFVPPEWFWKKETGGGILVENAGHLIDFVNTIMPPVESVVSVMDTLEFTAPREGIRVSPDIEDLAIVTMRHVGGAITTLANGCIGNGSWGVNMDITTDDCIISIRETKRILVERCGEVVESYVMEDSWNPIPFGIRVFVDYLRGGGGRVAGIPDALSALRIALGAGLSNKQGRVVFIERESGNE